MKKLSRNVKNYHRHEAWHLLLYVVFILFLMASVCLPRGVLYAASKNRKVKKEQTTTVKQLEEFMGVSFSVENIQKAGIKDFDFAKAIYDSILSDPNNFRTGMRVDRNGNIINSGTVLNSEEILKKGKAENVDGISLILSYFTGIIEANKKGIHSIKGIKNLRRAQIINLRDNNIEDVTELRMDENQIGTETDGTVYFGEPDRNVLIWLRGNSISHFCQWMNGRLLLDMNATEWTVYKPTTVVKVLRGTKEESISGVKTANIPIKFLCDGNPVILNKFGIKKYDAKSTIKDYTIVNNSANHAMSEMQFSNIKQSGIITVTFSANQMWGMYTADFSGNDNISINATSLKGEKPVYVELYTNITGDVASSGSIRLHKVDDAGKAIEGACFSLYKKEKDRDVLVNQDLSSDHQGNVFCSGLKAGNYYFIETSAPKGYVPDLEKKYEFAVEDGTISLKNKIRGSDFSTGDQLLTKDGSVMVHQDGSEEENTKEEKLEKGVFVKGGQKDQIDFQIRQTDTSRIQKVDVSWSAGLNGKQEGTMSYVFGDGEKTDTTTYCKNLEELERKVKQKLEEASQDDYQNVKVKAIFDGKKENMSIKTLEAKNQRTYGLKVYKEDSSIQPSKALEGAEFTLYRTYKDGDDQKKKTTISVRGQKIDVLEVQRKLSKIENEKAAALFDDLRASTRWYLEETKAPTGYQRMKDILTIDITKDGILKVEGNEAKKVDGEENIFYLTINNQKNISLPHTGSKGTLFYKMIGIVFLMLATVSGIVLWKRKGRKR